MTTDRDHSLREAAIDWAIRLADLRFADWEGFTAWLEADPAHAPAYDRVLAAGEAADAGLRSEPASLPILPPASLSPARRWRRPAAAGLVAASLAAVVSWGLISHSAAPYAIKTAPGGRRIVTIDAVTIALNGGTRLLLDRHDPHAAILERGEAMFDVRHDPAHPFALKVGGAEVQDVGTRFDVTREAASIRVSVAEGTVIYNPRTDAVRLDAGQTLTAADAASELRVARAAISDVGSWRENRLSYQQAPLATVAADLSRGLGIGITVAPGVARQPFSGVIAYGGNRDDFMAGLGALLDVGVKHDQQGLHLIRKADVQQ